MIIVSMFGSEKNYILLSKKLFPLLSGSFAAKWLKEDSGRENISGRPTGAMALLSVRKNKQVVVWRRCHAKASPSLFVTKRSL